MKANGDWGGTFGTNHQPNQFQIIHNSTHEHIYVCKYIYISIDMKYYTATCLLYGDWGQNTALMAKNREHSCSIQKINEKCRQNGQQLDKKNKSCPGKSQEDYRQSREEIAQEPKNKFAQPPISRRRSLFVAKYTAFTFYYYTLVILIAVLVLSRLVDPLCAPLWDLAWPRFITILL